MQILNPAVLTQQGMQLMNEAANGLNQISFPKAVTTDDAQYTNMNINQLEALADLDNIKQTIKPDTPLPAYVYTDSDGNQQLSDTGTVKSKTATTITLLFPNKDVTSDYYIQAIGLYAHDENKNIDILYSVMTAPEPRLQPAYDGTAPTSFKIKSITAVGLTDNLKVELSDFDNVSQEEFHETLKGYATITYVDEKLQNLGNVVTAVPPEVPALTVTANDTSVNYEITPPLYFGRAEIEKYVLYYKKHTETNYSSLDVDIQDLKGNLALQGGNQYDFKATAVNQHFESDSTTVQSYVLGKVPYNVKLSYTVDVANKAINYTITADSNPETPVTSYVLYFKDSQDSAWKSTTSGSLTGCILGHSYNLKAIAINAVGQSNVTDTQTSTIGNILNAPTLDLSFDGNLNYTITPADNSSNPLKLTYYTVYYKRDFDTVWQSLRTTNLTGSISPIQVGAIYQAKVTATNVIGESSANEASSDNIMTGTKPYNCMLNYTKNYGQKTLNWSATANSDYGLSITNYTLYYRDVTINSDWQKTGTSLINGFQNGHVYEIKATATNTVGESNFSASQTVYYYDLSDLSKLFSSVKITNTNTSYTATYTINQDYLKAFTAEWGETTRIKFTLSANFTDAGWRTFGPDTSSSSILGVLNNGSITLAPLNEDYKPASVAGFPHLQVSCNGKYATFFG
ncbi:fibronectin type III domain-containing protein [Apilactobacillus xinyiensis]|uniref:fibronectin type III domain-containing protein n=1 Tax=Apilactobacillus xinyiensis TaxID=2841032 RepID=UPI0033650BFA